MRKENPADIAIFEENAKHPFGMRDKIGYAAGDFANDLTFVIAALFMMKFYTDIMGVSAALVGTLMMVAKVVELPAHCRLTDTDIPYALRQSAPACLPAHEYTK